LAFRRFFLPVGVARTTLHDLRRQVKSDPHTPSDLGKLSRSKIHGGYCGQPEVSVIASRTAGGRVS
jgi:hypothetical protein